MYQLFVDFLSRLNHLDELIRWGGYIVLILIVFGETGLFFGFFLPGDSLLVTAGLFAAKGDLNIGLLLILMIGSAILGDAVGFEVGKLSGKKLFSRPDSWLFKKKHLERTQTFYDKHGGKTIVMARFMPVVRSFAPLVAGMAGMPYKKFAFFNIAGSVLWAGSMLSIGYILGRSIPDIDKKIHYVIAIVIFLSILPGIIAYLRSCEWRRWFENKSKVG